MNIGASELSGRSQKSELIRTIPARQSLRDEMASHTAAFLSRGAAITVCPPPEYVPVGVRPPERAASTELWTMYQAADAAGIARSTVAKRIRTGRGPAIAKGTGRRGDKMMFERETFMRWADVYKAGIAK